MLWLTGFFSHMNSWVMACSDFTGLEVRLGFKKHLKFCKSCYPRLTLPPVAMALLNFNQRLTCVRRQSKSKFTWIFWLIRVHTHDNLWICGCSDSLTIDLTFWSSGKCLFLMHFPEDLWTAYVCSLASQPQSCFSPRQVHPRPDFPAVMDSLLPASPWSLPTDDRSQMRLFRISFSDLTFATFRRMAHNPTRRRHTLVESDFLCFIACWNLLHPLPGGPAVCVHGRAWGSPQPECWQPGPVMINELSMEGTHYWSEISFSYNSERKDMREEILLYQS